MASCTDKVNKTAGEECDDGLLSDGTNSYLYGPDGLPIEQIDNADNALFLDEDAQAACGCSPTQTATSWARRATTPSGTRPPRAESSSPFGYEGMYRDAESGLYAMSGASTTQGTGQGLEYSSTPRNTRSPSPSNGNRTKSPVSGAATVDENSQGKTFLPSLGLLTQMGAQPLVSPYALGGGDQVNATVPLKHLNDSFPGARP